MSCEKKNRSTALEWLYCVRCDKFIALCSAMSGLPSRRKIVCAVVALLRAIFYGRVWYYALVTSHNLPPPPLSSAVLVHRRCLRHAPPPYPKRRPRPPPSSSPSRACLRRRILSSTLPTAAYQSPPSLNGSATRGKGAGKHSSKRQKR